jgi:hypothetical protein
LKNILKIAKEVEEHHLDKIESNICDGIIVDQVIIFGKGNGADKCPKCTNSKTKFLDENQNLRDRVPHLWKKLHADSLNKTLFDSKYPDRNKKSIYDKLSLDPISSFNDYRFV